MVLYVLEGDEKLILPKFTTFSNTDITTYYN